MGDPFRDDSTALEARAQELELELEDARRELTDLSAPREALAKALAQDTEDRQAEEAEIAVLRHRLTEMRVTLRHAERELATVSKEAKVPENPKIIQWKGIALGVGAALVFLFVSAKC